MSYSRRNFLKAPDTVFTHGREWGITVRGFHGFSCRVSCRGWPFSSEKAMFLVNGKAYAAEYEARTTLWEVISMKLGLTGTNRSWQSRLLRRLQRSGGRDAVLFLPHLGDRSRGQENSHH